MVQLTGDTDITTRCVQLAAGAASVYLCQTLYKKSWTNSQMEKKAEVEPTWSSSFIGRTKGGITFAVSKATSLFKSKEESLINGLSRYIKDIFERPRVQKTFPVKPEIVRPSDVKFVQSWSGKRVCIGSGQMGAVYIAYLKTTGQKVAVKCAADRRCDINFMIHEASLMTHLNDTEATPFCHGLMPVPSETDDPMCALVMELLVGDSTGKPPDMDSFVRQNCGTLTSEQVRSLFIDMVDKIRRIHSKGVVINDVKEANILVLKKDSNIQTCIIDFGSSRFGDYSFCLNKGLTKEEYYNEYSHMAPEIYEKRRVSPISDVYSLSSIFCDAGRFLRFGELMFIGIKCARVDPKTRPSIEKVLKFLSEMDLKQEDELGL